MSDILRVDYQGLESDTIAKLKHCESGISDVYEEMNKTVSSLTQYMEAESATEYINEFTKLVGPSIESMETIVNEYYTQLEQIANRFAEVDNKITSKIAVN